MFKIVLLRHAQSEGNRTSRLQGHGDSPLTDIGRRQAQALAIRWKAESRRFDLVLCSPLKRATETVEILKEVLRCPVEVNPIWLERNVGDLENVEYSAMEERASAPISRSPYHDAFGLGGEGQWVLQIRAAQALHSLLNKPEGSYLVISHGGMLNALMYSILGLSPGAFGTGPRFVLDNTGFVDLTYDVEHHRWSFISFNDLSHLKELPADK